MTLPVIIAGIALVCLIVYSATGGADFGGGVWDLVARGRTADAQRRMIARAIAPIWEANHIWLIVVVVVMFVAFPKAFAVITTALHIPLTIMLFGIVMRGTAFAFRSADTESHRRRWSLIFAVSSTITPVMLGICVGAISSGAIRANPATGTVSTDFVTPWLGAFPLAMGLFVLTIFAFLAAVYLIHETDDEEIREIFRRRALVGAVLVGAFALLTFLLSGGSAPVMRAGLTRAWWSIPFHVVTAGMALSAIWALWKRRYQLARLFAIAQVGLLVLGWGLSQFPYLVARDITIQNTAAPTGVLVGLLVAALVMVAVLIPSFWYLYGIFKGHREDLAEADAEADAEAEGK